MRGLGREEGIEHLVPLLRRNTGAIGANVDLHTIAKAFSRGSKRWHILSPIRFRLALSRCIKAVLHKIEKRPRNILLENVGFASRFLFGWING
jgi:hypothetical protein